MSRRREPIAEIADEDYRIVRHTHDVELARKLMRAELRARNGCPMYGREDGCRSAADEETCTHEIDPGQPQQVHVRIVPCLPGSYGYGCWEFEYRECKPGRGAFRAVVFQ